MEGETRPAPSCPAALEPVWLSATAGSFPLTWQAEQRPEGTERQERCAPAGGQDGDPAGLQAPSSTRNGLRSPPEDPLPARVKGRAWLAGKATRTQGSRAAPEPCLRPPKIGDRAIRSRGRSLCYCNSAIGASLLRIRPGQRPAVLVIYKLPFGILPAKFFSVVGMRHTPAIPEAAESKGWILRDTESRGGLGGASLTA